MITNSVSTRLRRMLREFRTASAGNVAITFALATLPIIGSVPIHPEDEINVDNCD